MKKYALTLSTFLLLGISLYFIATGILGNKFQESDQQGKLKFSGAGKALDLWFYERSYPSNYIPGNKLLSAYKQVENQRSKSNAIPGKWESMGPENIGGRMLCIEFHPTDTNIMYAGSASGGLWRTDSLGKGRYAWRSIPTGFPVLGVSSIAIDQNNPSNIIIGTGEVYGSGLSEPGIINRLTRGSYGIGILKTTDEGNTWTHVLNFTQDSLAGVSDIEINPNNSNIVYAATNFGVYKSVDAGDNWSKIFSEFNCVDIEIDPVADSVLYLSQGNFDTVLNNSGSGIYKSVDAGNTFVKLTNGLPNTWSGSAKLVLEPGSPNTVYASIQMSDFSTASTIPTGIYKSTDGGNSWNRINNQNIALYQGWYSHDLAVNPSNVSELIQVGVDAWKSIDGGTSFNKKSSWQLWTFGQVSVNLPDGTSPAYIHADIHEVRYHPLMSNRVFYASDGGIFTSRNAGETFRSLNGGLQTTQFYADMGSSHQDSAMLIAGAQDNATYIYRNDPSWFRVIGGDGMSASIRPSDDQVVYGSSQNLRVRKATDGGYSFQFIGPNVGSNPVPFNGQFEISQVFNDFVYAGSNLLHISINAGDNWSTNSNNPPDGNNVIVKLGLSNQNLDKVYIATSPSPLTGSTSSPKIFVTNNAGGSYTNITSNLPNRLIKDIEVDELDDQIVYVTLSGFGTDHVYRTTDGGNNWSSIDNGLPDVPTNCIMYDPLFPNNLYVGNDLGVWFSPDYGNTWVDFNDSLPEAIMVMDLDYSPVNRKIRIASHGRGVYQRDLAAIAPSSIDSPLPNAKLSIYPNPVEDIVNLKLKEDQLFDFEVFDLKGNSVKNGKDIPADMGISVKELNSGTYVLRVISNGRKMNGKFLKN